MSLLKFIILNVLILVFPCVQSSESQEKQDASQPTSLALEVIFYKGKPPAYLSVPGPDSQAKGGWFARFGSVTSPEPLDVSLPVRAVNVISRQEGDIVRVSVSVFLGAKFHEKEAPVATFRLHENEKIRVDELNRFGVEPFEITLIRAPALISNIPAVINNADSIELIGIDANNSTLPSYRLSLRNRSGKNVVALQIDVHVSTEKRLSSQPMGKEGHPLIKAGADFQTNIPGTRNTTTTRQGFMPNSPQDQSILIGTAVFDDGTYEGDPNIAAQIKARVAGQKLQLTEVVHMLDNLAEPGDPDDQVLERIRRQASSLRDDVDMNVVDKLLKDFPGMDRVDRDAIRVSFQATLHSIKRQLLDGIDQFEKDEKGSPDRNTFKAWLNITRGRFREWLSRL